MWFWFSISLHFVITHFIIIVVIVIVVVDVVIIVNDSLRFVIKHLYLNFNVVEGYNSGYLIFFGAILYSHYY
jgi:hypothetical protein